MEEVGRDDHAMRGEAGHRCMNQSKSDSNEYNLHTIPHSNLLGHFSASRLKLVLDRERLDQTHRYAPALRTCKIIVRTLQILSNWYRK